MRELHLLGELQAVALPVTQAELQAVVQLVTQEELQAEVLPVTLAELQAVALLVAQALHLAQGSHFLSLVKNCLGDKPFLLNLNTLKALKQEAKFALV